MAVSALRPKSGPPAAKLTGTRTSRPSSTTTGAAGGAAAGAPRGGGGRAWGSRRGGGALALGDPQDRNEEQQEERQGSERTAASHGARGYHLRSLAGSWDELRLSDICRSLG